jgi:aconitate hydratase/homoaconitate hydratase
VHGGVEAGALSGTVSGMTSRPPMTLTQKILAHHARGLARPFVRAGDVLRLRVDWTMASELAWNGMNRTYAALGRPALHNPERFFLAVDHTVDPVALATDPKAQALARLSRDFARERGVRHFHDANETILHTRFYRELVQPGQVVLGADSHTTSHGGLGAFAIGLGGADVTAAMVLGETWLEVPEAIAIEYEGSPGFGIGGKDIILRTLGLLGRNTVALERTVEFRGEAVRRFSTDTRFTLANMTAEFGGLNGIFEADAVALAWLATREGEKDSALCFRADEGAPYLSRYQVSLDRLGPLVARPSSPDNVVPVEEAVGTALHGCFIGACTTTEEELVLAALVLEEAFRERGPRAPARGRLVVPGDLGIVERMRQRGLWAHYERAGFRIGPPGCSMCLGVASEKARPGEVWLSSQNRNYENRMGAGSLAWLASAATVAASSVEMAIADPRPYLARIDRERFARLVRREALGLVPEVLIREPEVEVSSSQQPGREHPHPSPLPEGEGALRGCVQRFGDHVDTDAIIPGEFCHLTDPQALGRHCFQHVRPEFVARARELRNIIVAGEGWGTGSSREQAVWALQGAGIRAVIARSFAFIHRRNLVNDAVPHLVITDPDFHALVQEGEVLDVDLVTATVTHAATGRRFQATPVSPLVRALQAHGGLVPAVRRLGPRLFASLSP